MFCFFKKNPSNISFVVYFVLWFFFFVFFGIFLTKVYQLTLILILILLIIIIIIIIVDYFSFLLIMFYCRVDAIMDTHTKVDRFKGV